MPPPDFTLRITSDRRGGFLVQLAVAPFGGASDRLVLPAAFESWDRTAPAVEGWGRGDPAAADAEVSDPPESRGTEWVEPPRSIDDLGAALFAGLLPGRLHDDWLASRVLACATDRGRLRLALCFDLAEPGASRLASLPWELLFDPHHRQYLARSPGISFCRFLLTPEPRPFQLRGQPRILVVAAQPNGLPPLGLTSEKARLVESWPRAEVEVLAPPSLATLSERLRREDVDVLHFMGHGSFDQSTGEAVLFFEGPGRTAIPVPAPLLAEKVTASRSIQLAVLNACDGARLPRREGIDPYSGAATALMMAGLPAAVAMQLPISDRAAIQFSGGLYRELAEGRSLEEAVAAGRQAILDEAPRSREWATPALYRQHLPAAGSVAPERRDLFADCPDFSALLDHLTRDFVGRSFVWEAVEGFTRRHPSGYLFVRGEPGIGKSALLAQLVRLHRYPHHFNSRREGVVRPESFLAYLSAQLIERFRLPYGALPREATRDGGFLLRVLAESAQKLAVGEKLLIAVDALDEAETEHQPARSTPLFLPEFLPDGVFFLIASRPLDPARWPLVRADQEILELEEGSPQNLADVRRYVETRLGREGIRAYRARHGLSEGTFIEEMVGRSEGNFMYLSYVLPAIEEGALVDRELSTLPTGLDRYYRDHWQRMKGRDLEAWQAGPLRILATLTLMPRPVSFQLLCRFVGARRSVVVQALDEWRPFLHVQKGSDAPTAAPFYSVYHQSFRDFIVDQAEIEEEQLDLREVRERMLEALLDDSGDD
ncbi:MAG TPA: CHAT domain-containing protein [Thermoanaerobaculia bacterium]|nr:CHAT domain-containing protein [Thermoanaerobaculia bacterium]